MNVSVFSPVTAQTCTNMVFLWSISYFWFVRSASFSENTSAFLSGSHCHPLVNPGLFFNGFFDQKNMDCSTPWHQIHLGTEGMNSIHQMGKEQRGGTCDMCDTSATRAVSFWQLNWLGFVLRAEEKSTCNSGELHCRNIYLVMAC